jgi:hypothetical protein
MDQLARAQSVKFMEFRESVHWLAMKIKTKINSLIHSLNQETSEELFFDESINDKVLLIIHGAGRSVITSTGTPQDDLGWQQHLLLNRQSMEQFH